MDGYVALISHKNKTAFLEAANGSYHNISFNAGGDIPLTKVVVDEKYVEEHLSEVIAGQSVKKYIL